MNTAELTTLIAELIEQNAASQQVLAKLSAEIERARGQRDPFVTHLFRARRSWRSAMDSRKSTKRAEEAAQRSFVEAEKVGFKGSLREWMALLGMGV